jgi:hypothetical protein
MSDTPKPWNQRWEALGTYVVDPDRHEELLNLCDQERGDRAILKLASAAPEMARLLRLIVRMLPCGCDRLDPASDVPCLTCQIGEALEKAGVPPF